MIVQGKGFYNRKKMLKQFVDQLRTGMGDAIVPNEDGSYSLFLEPNLHILLRENAEAGISFLSFLAPLPEENKEEFLLKAMIANLFGRETGGAALGLDREGKKVTLLSFLPQQLNYRDFHDLLEDFVNYAEAWKLETTVEQPTD